MSRSELGELLCRRALGSGGRNTERRLIAVRNKSEYDRCLARLKQEGVNPVKSLRGAGLLCVHADKRRDWSEIKAHPSVRFVEKDAVVRTHGALRRTVKRSAAAGVPWNVTRVQAPVLWPRTRGGGVRIAVMDTGIGPHPDLVVAGGVNTTGGRSFRDDNGHGTHVAGIAAGRGGRRGRAGVAPRVSLYAVKVLGSDGLGFISDIVEGIEWCRARRIRVINMSFGLPPGVESRAMREAVRRAYRSGIAIAASAGNAGRASGGLDSPAGYPETIAVAACTRGNRIAGFSSRGRGIAVAAPGSAIRSTWPGGGYRTMSGTSMAAPHAAAGAALLLGLRGNLRPAAVKRAMRRGAGSLGFAVRAQGAGLLQLQNAART
ncbi:MAG TPA: S8 family serine peptidase [Paenibacillus sp.]|uniref:S8 family serine peptidase n=1 Tax=Paenibacillus sp. TaxID=58172 RepID=UPI0028D7E694|nr:S8 family serine peptidase [Paenibacillus sp.]HUC90817.1 S8 family serine peptidase [Paenibacillus sp.]